MKTTNILILGAGCAGTSLAHYLESFGYVGKVVLIDSQTDFNREQRWCSWSKLPESFQPLIKNSWKEWTVCDEKKQIVKNSKRFSYQQIYAPDFFRHFHSDWQNAQSQIEMSLGEKVLQVNDQENCVEVITNKQTWQADLVFDARHQGSPNLKKSLSAKSIYLHQTFLGWTIKFPEKKFNRKNATLMDFRTKQTDGINFIYVLPYSESEALVESTSFSQNLLNRSGHFSALKEYIAQNFGENYEIKAEEFGELPMTTAKFSTKISERIFAVGIAGGNARPSSGYAFQRIQQHTAKIARSIVNRENISENFASSKYNFYDSVFLEAIARNPECGKNFFMKMFENVGSDSLIKFLTDESSFFDDLAVISALPKFKFGEAALRSWWRKFGAKDRKDEIFQIPQSPLPNSVDKSARRLVAR